MSEALVGALGPHHRLLAEVARTAAEESKPVAEARLEPSPAERRPRLRIEQNRERRMGRYEAVMGRFRQGVSQREIGRQCGLSRKTVRRFIRVQGFPERKQRQRF
jgi:DNA-binding NarL/FixJ family response regulator